MIIKFLLLLTFISFSAFSAVVPPFDPSEEFPAGTGTTSDFSVQAFSHPLSGTLSTDRRNFTVGNSFFNKVWVSSPASTTARDGLGPIYNAVACSSCHFKDGRGRGLPEIPGPTDISLLFRLRLKGITREVLPHPVYGGQFQPFGVQDVPGEGESRVKYEKIHLSYNDGSLADLLTPIYEFVNLNFGEMGSQTIISPRVAPQMIGLGPVEAIPEGDILRNEDTLDADADGISGRVNWSEYIICSPDVIASWSFGTRKIKEKMQLEYDHVKMVKKNSAKHEFVNPNNSIFKCRECWVGYYPWDTGKSGWFNQGMRDRLKIINNMIDKNIGGVFADNEASIKD